MATREWIANYDESKIPEYSLPDPLIAADGTTVDSAAAWVSKRRPELLRLFETHVYGRMPGTPSGVATTVLSVQEGALGGLAVRKEVRVRFGADPNAPVMTILLYIPSHVARPSPGFLALNFRGNHSVHPDPGITLSESWMPDDPACGIVNHRATSASRGARYDRWPIEQIVYRGFMVATVYCGDLDPDYHDGFRNGVHGLFDDGADPRPGDAWGTVGAWAWGLSRALDYLYDDPDVDASKVAVMGHSRLGKTALWAGATDPRFAAVISNDSGCGGAALSRRCFGETVSRITQSFPHWFCGNFRGYADNENALPVDQHELICLVAPRPVYVASAVDDRWADPRGEFLSALHANPVYRLLGTEGLPATEWPPVDHPVSGRIGYHVRSGKHDVTLFDWDRYMGFMEKHGLGRSS